MRPDFVTPEAPAIEEEEDPMLQERVNELETKLADAEQAYLEAQRHWNEGWEAHARILKHLEEAIGKLVEADQDLAEARAQVQEAQRKEAKAVREKTELRRRLEDDPESAAGNQRGSAGDNPVDIEALVQRVKTEVLKDMPWDMRAAPKVPREVLRRRFLDDEVNRMLQDVRNLEAQPRRYLLWLIQDQNGYVATKSLIRHITGEQVKGGSKYVAGTRNLRSIAQLGLVELKDGVGWRETVRDRIGRDLDDYQVSDSDIEAVYEQVVAVLAGVTEDEEQDGS